MSANISILKTFKTLDSLTASPVYFNIGCRSGYGKLVLNYSPKTLNLHLSWGVRSLATIASTLLIMSG